MRDALIKAAEEAVGDIVDAMCIPGCENWRKVEAAAVRLRKYARETRRLDEQDGHHANEV
jgi:hypothetical protein